MSKHQPIKKSNNTAKRTSQEKSLSVTKTEVYQGALPPPDMMQGYQQLDKSFPDRIITMAEKEQNHSHKVESKRNTTILIQSSIGLLAGLITMGTLCYLIYFAIASGQTSVAITIVGSMAAIIGVFIYKSKM